MTITNRVSLKSVMAGNTPIADVPDAPTIGVATAGSESATVTYTAAATGGTATTFTATSSPGSITGTGSSPITVSGLTGGTAYTFTVRGSNSTGTSPESAATSPVTPTVATAYESIATATVSGGGAGYVEFTSIPQTYTHLQIRGIARTNRNDPRDAMYFRFNGDTGSNYAWHWFHGNGTSVPAGNDINAGPTVPWSVVTPGSQASSNTFGMVVADILDYKNTSKFKVSKILTGFDDNASGDAKGRLWFISTLWRDTSAISSIYITSPYGGTLQQYSHFALYGIKGA